MGATLGSLSKPSRHANIEAAEHESSDLFVAEKNLSVCRRIFCAAKLSARRMPGGTLKQQGTPAKYI
jgi:hypothetical protein